MTDKVKFAHWQFVWPHQIYIMASTPSYTRCLSTTLHRNNSPDLMRRWNAFNCGEVCIDHRIDQHIVDQIENSLEIWSTLMVLREHCKVTKIILCFSCCSSKSLTPQAPNQPTFPHISIQAALFQMVWNFRLLAAGLMMVCILPRHCQLLLNPLHN